MKINQKGFSLVEILILLLVLGSIAGVGWYVYQQQTNNKQTSTEQSSNTPEEATNTSTYKRTTTVPSDWKTVVAKNSKFTISVPANWHTYPDFDQIKKYPESAGLVPTSVSDLAPKPYQAGVVDFRISITTYDTSLSEVKDKLNDSLKNVPGGTKIRDITIDGHDAVELTVSVGQKDEYKLFLISANGKTYEFQEVDSKDNPQAGYSAQDSLTIFESLKFQ